VDRGISAGAGRGIGAGTGGAAFWVLVTYQICNLYAIYIYLIYPFSKIFKLIFKLSFRLVMLVVLVTACESLSRQALAEKGT
jgi:hypothetical protein